MATIEQRKEKALELMAKMDIYKPYIKGFRDSNKVCFYENFAGFWVYQEPEIEKKMKEIEEEYNCTCYAITHEYTQFGECYDFLLVSNYEEEWDYLLYSDGHDHTVFAYVWNKSDDDCSELGDVTVKSFGGGLKRIA